MGIETLIGAGATLIGGAMQSDAAGGASDAQAAGTAADIAERRRQFDLQRTDTEPYRRLGANALQSLYDQTTAPASQQQIQMDPGYQFGLSEGQRAIDQQFAASGGRISGAAMRRGTRYATDYATTGYNAAYQRRQDALNRLSTLAGIGQTATGASAAAGGAAADGIGRALSSQGDATAAARMYQGNTWANTGNQLAALYQRNQGGMQPPSYGRGNWTPGYGDGFQTDPMGGY